MLKKILALLCVTAAPSVFALDYNQNITAIFGTGNPDTGWTAASGSGVTVALRAKNRDNASTANVNGVYSYATPLNAANNRLLWNYEFSLSSGTAPLTAYDFYLQADDDSSASTSLATVNALTYWADNSFGTAATVNGAGTETGIFAGATVSQNSQNGVFAQYPGGALSAVANATYDFVLFAVQAGAGADGARLASASIQVVVGQGGAASSVPDAGSTAMLLGMGLTGLVAARRRMAK